MTGKSSSLIQEAKLFQFEKVPGNQLLKFYTTCASLLKSSRENAVKKYIGKT